LSNCGYAARRGGCMCWRPVLRSCLRRRCLSRAAVGYYCPLGSGTSAGSACPGFMYCAGLTDMPVSPVCTASFSGYLFNLSGLVRTTSPAWSANVPDPLYFNFCADQPDWAFCDTGGPPTGACLASNNVFYHGQYYSTGPLNFGTTSTGVWALIDGGNPCLGVTYALSGDYVDAVTDGGGLCGGQVSTTFTVNCNAQVLGLSVLGASWSDTCALNVATESASGCCAACPVGMGLSAGACNTCVAGAFSDGTIACALCHAGTYGASTGLGPGCSGLCTCAAGSYCPPGSLVAAPGVPCPAGSFCTGLSAVPQPCTAVATYACGLGSIAPSGTSCPLGSYCTGGAAPSVLCTCFAGSYCGSTSITAWGSPCPVGAWCSGGTAQPLPCTCALGFYCPVSSTAASPGLACPAGVLVRVCVCVCCVCVRWTSISINAQFCV
jgi:hypothetical protein